MYNRARVWPFGLLLAQNPRALPAQGYSLAQPSIRCFTRRQFLRPFLSDSLVSDLFIGFRFDRFVACYLLAYLLIFMRRFN